MKLKEDELAIVKCVAKGEKENASVEIGIDGNANAVESMVGEILFLLSESSGIFANLLLAMKCIMARRSNTWIRKQ